VTIIHLFVTVLTISTTLYKNIAYWSITQKDESHDINYTSIFRNRNVSEMKSIKSIGLLGY